LVELGEVRSRRFCRVVAGMAAVLEMGELSGVVLVTIAFFILHMTFMLHQVFGKLDAGAKKAIAAGQPFDRFNYKAFPRWEMADRTFVNLQEQQMIFLLPLWLHAVFVDPHRSASLGWFWLFFRLLFPILWSAKGAWNVLIEISTQPNYAICSYFLVALAYKAISGSILLGSDATSLQVFLYCVGATMVVHAIVMPAGFLLTQITKQGFTGKAAESEGLLP